MNRTIAGLGLAFLTGIAAPLAAQSTEVTISPVGKTVVGTNQVSIMITWCGYPPPTSNIDPNNRVIKANNVDITGDFDLQWNQSACHFVGSVGDEQLWSSSGTLTVDTSTGPVTLWADVSNGYGYHWSDIETYYPPAPHVGVAVIAEQQFVTPPPSASRAERFTIKNLGNVTDTFALTASGCSSGAVSTSCTLSSSSVAVSSGSSTTITASYTASGTAGATGLLRLKAVSAKDATIKDSTWTDVTIKAVPSVGVSIVGLAPGLNDLAERSACVTIALTDDAAAECGDLRLTHAMPAVRTMGTARAPTLIYNSQFARTKPLVVADVRLSTSVSLPDSVIACIKISGTSRGCGRWAGSAWGSAGESRRIVVAGDDGTWNTGAQSITLEVSAKNGNQGPYSATERLFIVNRTASAFGAGWWVAGLEQLTSITSSDMIWIGGDGSVRRYVKDAGGVFRAPKFAARDSIITAGTGYVRKTAGSARVYFSSTGQHDSTVSKLGYLTKFTYSSGRLSAIDVPVASGSALSYSFTYTSNLLTSVTAPGSRTTTIYRTSARVDSIADPDGKKVRFGSSTGANQYVVVTRKDRRGNTTTFSYDATGIRVSQVDRPLSNTTVLGVAEIKGLATPVLLDSAFTQVDGPRSDVTDVVRFWVNGHGSPTRIRNPLGQETRISYNSVWAGLADSVLAANRLASRAFYDTTRGLPDSTRVYDPVGTGSNATTKYKWTSAFNSVAKITSATGVVDTISYNSDGTRAFEQHGTSSNTRVNYGYDSNKLLTSMIMPGSDTVLVRYTALGNARWQRSPAGLLSMMFADAIGRDTVVFSPRKTSTTATDSAKVVAEGLRQTTRYDAMDRDTLSIMMGPQDTMPNSRVVPADTIRLRSTYDEEGNRLSVTRTYSKNTGTSGGSLYASNPSEWVFDALNRVTQQHDPGSGVTNFYLDAAGNDTSRVTARSYTIKSKFDAANRVTQRIIPQVTYSSSQCHYPLSGSCLYTFPTIEGSSLCIAVDTLRYDYDAAGNMTKADNNWAKVRRRYSLGGFLVRDTLITRRYYTEAPDPSPCGGGDRHGLAESALASDWAAHIYVTQYGYDVDGRRTSLTLPDQLDPCSGSCVQNYKYNTVTGALDTLVHVGTSGGTLTTRFARDDQFRLTTTYHPGGVSTTNTYDKESRVTLKLGPATSDTLRYDATGRVISGGVYHPNLSTWHNLALGYSGIGALQYVQGSVQGITSEEYKTDALGDRLWVRDPEMLDGIDRTRYNVIASESGQLTESDLGTGGCNTPPNNYSCHPVWYAYEYFQSHDASGNVEATWGKDTRGTNSGNATQVPDESRSYYGAGEQLMYFNRQVGWSTPGEGTGVFEEYRYDALGRRVYSRARRTSSCSYPCEAYVQRTVWDGNQVLAEIRSSGKDSVASTYMDGEGSVASGDGSDLYGIVLYANAAGIDQPVGILKKYASGWAYVTPHANWKGEWTYGTYDTGGTCYTATSTCPAWPGYYLSADRDTQGATRATYSVWWGSLIQNQADGSGLLYQRNRYYDPRTGRFTQLDPIGLGGGLNLYGLAGGDPVNFSDPLGLSSCKTNVRLILIACQLWNLMSTKTDGIEATPPEPTRSIISIESDAERDALSKASRRFVSDNLISTGKKGASSFKGLTPTETALAEKMGARVIVRGVVGGLVAAILNEVIQPKVPQPAEQCKAEKCEAVQAPQGTQPTVRPDRP